MTNPRKKKSTKPKKKTTFSRGQQLSDKLAYKVSKGKMTYEQAMKTQKKQDDAVSKITKVGRKVRSSSESLNSKRKYTKARYKLDRHGNKVAY